MATLDPEVAELLASSRRIVGLAYRLSQDLNNTVDDLEGFSTRYEGDQRVTPGEGPGGVERRV